MRARFALLIFSAAVILCGCTPYSNSFAPIERELIADNPQGALEKITRNKPPDRDRLLFDLNRAMILLMIGDHDQSIMAFDDAKAAIGEFDAISVSEQVSSTLVNDGMIAYYGDDYERVYLHFYDIINYLLLGDSEGARVETMQADERLKHIGTGRYEDDAAMLYLSGIVFEATREPENALVAYRRAYQSYKNGFFGVAMPQSLKYDLVRLSDRLRIGNELRQYRREFGIDRVDYGKNTGEMIVIASVGLAPIKRPVDFMSVSPLGLISISIPRYERRPRFGAPVLAIGNQQIVMERLSDIAAIAHNTLEAKMPEIIARTTARIVAKKGMEHAAAAVGGKNDNGAGAFAKLVVGLVNIATEVADTRSWLTLPDEIYIARAHVPSGRYNVFVAMQNGVQKDYGTLEIKAGDRLLLAPNLIPRYTVR
ncbi:MAG: hypothetical protein LBN32_00560 [Helicobacteraceae bacterium]|jgi:hypothetical protein|nr:hypothetical protein [Helicobacteraceae bacterium]